MNNKITGLKPLRPQLCPMHKANLSRRGSGLRISVKLLPHLLQKTQMGHCMRDRFVKCWETTYDLGISLLLLKTGFYPFLSQNFSAILEKSQTSQKQSLRLGSPLRDAYLETLLHRRLQIVPDTI